MRTCQTCGVAYPDSVFHKGKCRPCPLCRREAANPSRSGVLNPWSAERKKIRRKMVRHGLGTKPAVLVADSMGMTYDDFYALCQKWSIATRYKNKAWNKTELAKLIALRSAGTTWKVIAETLKRPLRSCTVKYDEVTKNIDGLS